MATTWMCDNGRHGDSERRYLHKHDDVWQGKCAGSVVNLGTPNAGALTLAEITTDCDCDCHHNAYITLIGDAAT